MIQNNAESVLEGFLAGFFKSPEKVIIGFISFAHSAWKYHKKVSFYIFASEVNYVYVQMKWIWIFAPNIKNNMN